MCTLFRKKLQLSNRMHLEVHTWPLPTGLPWSTHNLLQLNGAMVNTIILFWIKYFHFLFHDLLFIDVLHYITLFPTPREEQGDSPSIADFTFVCINVSGFLITNPTVLEFFVGLPDYLINLLIVNQIPLILYMGIQTLNSGNLLSWKNYVARYFLQNFSLQFYIQN